ncbi:MAG: thiamine phosphate synthase [Lachnospiraceae bacterium]|nr:thiamine phosphate synthase [Lachnospiraceae bacterium]
MRVICITNHDLLPDKKMAEMSYEAWRDAYVDAISGIAACHPEAIVLREKLLSGIDYTNLYEAVSRKTAAEDTFIIWHDHYEALRLFMRFHRREEWPWEAFFSGREAKAMTGADFRELKREGIRYGLPCHSMIELSDAVRSDADFIAASHIFETECKRGRKPKGTEFLREITGITDIPVIALGGINTANAVSCTEAGAAGVAVMSLAMREDKSTLRELVEMQGS